MGVPQRKPDESLPRYDALDGVETAWYCWNAVPLSSKPWIVRWIIRTLATAFGFSCGDTMEGLCIVRTEQEAREIIKHYAGGNAQQFPVARSIEDSLPVQAVQFGKRLPNDPEGERYYSKHKLPMVAIPRAVLKEAEKVLKRI